MVRGADGNRGWVQGKDTAATFALQASISKNAVCTSQFTNHFQINLLLAVTAS